MALLNDPKYLMKLRAEYVTQMTILDKVYEIETGMHFSVAVKDDIVLGLSNSAAKAWEEKDFTFSKIRAIDALLSGKRGSNGTA